jgi:uncharacterized protein (DUF488 family)
MNQPEPPVLYTIGHSNHATERFLALLDRHAIALLIDVRSKPGSRFSPQFNRRALEAGLKAAGKRYVWLGESLGGRPAEPAFRLTDGTLDYQAIARSAQFQAGLEQLRPLLAEGPAVLLCAEENPALCHRKWLVGDALRADGVRLLHIRKDGGLTTDEALDSNQADLFGHGVAKHPVNPRSGSRAPARPRRP